jgi:hypothetical protein
VIWWVIWIGLILLGLYFTIQDFRPKSREIRTNLPIPPTLDSQIDQIRNQLKTHLSLQTSINRRLNARVKALEDRLKNNDHP